MAGIFANVRWIFFDVGYTLLDETGAWQDAFERIAATLQRRGRRIDADEIWQTFRDVCRDFEPLQWLGLCRRIGIDEAEARQLAGGYKHALEVPHPGAADVLRHRIVLSYEALAEQVTADDIVVRILKAVPAPEKPLERHAGLAASA